MANGRSIIAIGKGATGENVPAGPVVVLASVVYNEVGLADLKDTLVGELVDCSVWMSSSALWKRGRRDALAASTIILVISCWSCKRNALSGPRLRVTRPDDIGNGDRPKVHEYLDVGIYRQDSSCSQNDRSGSKMNA